MNSLTHSIIDELKIIYYLIFWAVYDFSEFTKRSCIITFQGIRNHILWVLWGLVSHWQRHMKMWIFINEMYVTALLSYDHYVSEKQSGKLFNCFIRSEIYECYNIE